MPVVSISMPESLLDRLDGFIDDHGYSGRSEAMREGVRGLLREFDGEDESREVVCVITIMFDHDSGAELRLSELRHQHDELVTSNVHSHADDNCLELFVTEGTVDEIGPFVSRLRTVDGVVGVDHSILSADRTAVA